ncbi:hypothetical protein [Streptosporangium sandarakinum]|uniref:hypothetical protein n=1 Tax=Streptosporangium sandarakinum TaxID=1260955 RepID=UPI0033BEDE55
MALPAPRDNRAVATALMVVVLVSLSACQVGPDELFTVVNGTEDTVVVTWNGLAYATLPPVEQRQIGLPGDCDSVPPPVARLSATSDKGERYDYPGPVCNGRTWRVGPTVSPSPR